MIFKASQGIIAKKMLPNLNESPSRAYSEIVNCFI